MILLPGINLEAKTIATFEDGLKGTVADLVTGETLIGAAILIEGTTKGTVTDLEGAYDLPLEAGSYRLSVSYIGYKPVVLSVTIETDGTGSIRCEGPASMADGETGLTIYLEPDNEALSNAVVTARKNLESLQALQNERIMSGFAIENMGADEMTLKGISNAQESVAKLSGISIADAGQLVVRGLGDRYSTTTLNGLPIASPNPDNKLIPLDIFPASTIQNITVSKVYEASSFADYSGAHVDISTKEGDCRDFFSVSFSSGGYFSTLSGQFYRMDGKSLFLGRRLDPTAESIPYSEFREYSRSRDIFGTSFHTFGRKALPDLNGGIGFGKDISLGRQTLSILASASIKTGDESLTDAFYRTYEASSSGNIKSDYTYDSYTEKMDIAALADIDCTLRTSDNIGLTVFFARNASDTHLDRQGYDYQESYDLVGSNQVTHIYTLQNFQLSGHHDVGGWDIDWGSSYTMTSSDEPDRRQVMYRRGNDGILRFFDLNQQETQRYFGKLVEDELVADIKASLNFNDSDRLRIGLTAKDKRRDFKSTRFYYDVRALNEQIDDAHNPDAYLNFDNIRDGLININRSQYARDRYSASSLIGAAFAETDLHFGGRWLLNAGLRFEASRQSVDYNDDVEDLTRNLDSFDLFPALNLRYELDHRSLLRLSLSRTITRPSFVEMAPFLYQESFGGAQVRGNEELKNAYNYNLDLRYELFSDHSTDMLSLTAYCKLLQNPIERTQRLSGGATEHSFQNAENGMAAGLELEFKRELVKGLIVSANGSLMYTNVILPEGGAYTNDRRSLQGASPYLANVDISYSTDMKDGSAITLTLLYNLQGPRIHAVGIMGLGDMKQMALHTLDFTGSYTLKDRLSIRLAFKNLLNSTVRFRQDIPNAGKTVDVEQWRLGTGFEIGISYSI